MINKNELIKLLGIAMEEKGRIEGKIELLGNQLRMIAQKETKIIEEAKKLKIDKNIIKRSGKSIPKTTKKVEIKQ